MIKYLSVFLGGLWMLVSCNQNKEKSWDVEISDSKKPVEIIDISKTFYSPTVTLEQFKKEFPFFLSPTFSNDFYHSKRKDSTEILIYKKASNPEVLQNLQKDLPKLYARIHHYFPDFKNPKTYVYSSATAMYEEPVMYNPEQHAIIIDLSAFLGEESEFYKGIESYYTKSMTQDNLFPKISQAIAQSFVPYNLSQAKFLNQMVYQGKIMVLQDAFLPDTKDEFKIGYSPKQYQWAKANESNIWNYFVENDLLFSDDARLSDRFISPAPFSKFYTEIDNESSPQIGIFIGWQICKAFLKQYPKTTLRELLMLDGQTLFNKSKYKGEQ